MNKIGFVFPGQGSQYVGMGRDAHDSSEAARRVFETADACLGFSLSDLCFNGPAEQLNDTQYAQPAILTASVAQLFALRALWEEAGISVVPEYVAGHSLGEYSALVAAGAIDFEDALKLVWERGRLMKEEGEKRPGGMAAVIGLSHEALESVVSEASAQGTVVIANSNSPVQTVISGEVAALLKAMELATQGGAARVARLAVSIASHSPLMQHAASQLAKAIAEIKMHDPHIPLVANITGQALTTVEEIKHELAEQLTKPVAWVASVRSMVENGVGTFVEVGPGAVLSGLIKRISGDVRVLKGEELVKTVQANVPLQPSPGPSGV